MDITWLTDRIAVGGGIWTSDNMAQVARAGITHIIDMQIEFDDTALGEAHGIEVLWNPTDDDFEAKPAWLFQRGVDFAEVALEGTGREIIHPLRGGSSPRADDGAGNFGIDGMATAGCDGVDSRAASGGGLCRCVRAERGRVSNGRPWTLDPGLCLHMRARLFSVR